VQIRLCDRGFRPQSGAKLADVQKRAGAASFQMLSLRPRWQVQRGREPLIHARDDCAIVGRANINHITPSSSHFPSIKNPRVATGTIVISAIHTSLANAQFALADYRTSGETGKQIFGPNEQIANKMASHGDLDVISRDVVYSVRRFLPGIPRPTGWFHSPCLRRTSVP
jgi:hypothetical protein